MRQTYYNDVIRKWTLQTCLVADTLEAQWNEALQTLTEAHQHYEKCRAQERLLVDEKQRERVMALARDFPLLWDDPATNHRKRMLRLLVQDVTLQRNQEIFVHIRFNGGTTKTLTIAKPLSAGEVRKSDPKLIAEIDLLLDERTEKQIVAVLNQRGRINYEGHAINIETIRRIRRTYALMPTL